MRSAFSFQNGTSIPNYFKNYEVPIICYKYNKPIRGAIFNFNKLVSDLDIETCNPDSETARTLNRFIRLRVMLLRAI